MYLVSILDLDDFFLTDLKTAIFTQRVLSLKQLPNAINRVNWLSGNSANRIALHSRGCVADTRQRFAITLHKMTETNKRNDQIKLNIKQFLCSKKTISPLHIPLCSFYVRAFRHFEKPQPATQLNNEPGLFQITLQNKG